jgi:hypothetical protein
LDFSKFNRAKQLEHDPVFGAQLPIQVLDYDPMLIGSLVDGPVCLGIGAWKVTSITADHYHVLGELLNKDGRCLFFVMGIRNHLLLWL